MAPREEPGISVAHGEPVAIRAGGQRAPRFPGSISEVATAVAHWRIRLVAYGARLESVLGASPRGFESPILRERCPLLSPARAPFFVVLPRRAIRGL